MKKVQFWKEDEFVNYEEYAQFGISGDALCRNIDRCDALGIPQEDRCPLCAKALKEGSYKLMVIKIASNGTTDYYFNPAVVGEVVKVGNGCFANLKKAYNKKYNVKA